MITPSLYFPYFHYAMIAVPDMIWLVVVLAPVAVSTSGIILQLRQPV
jgi:hypothetical protein